MGKGTKGRLPRARRQDEPVITLSDCDRIAFSLCSVIKNGAEWIFGADKSSKYELLDTLKNSDSVSAALKCGFANGGSAREEFTVSSEGVDVLVSGEGEVGFCLPVFEFDGENYTEISFTENTLSVKYLGFECRYTTDGKITDLGKIAENRNGRYRTFLAVGKKLLKVKIEILKL